jgi:hypothetical protein
MRKAAAALLVAAGSTLGAALLRRSRGRRSHVDLYFTDGSMVSLPEGSPEADRLIPLARDVVSAARA